MWDLGAIAIHLGIRPKPSFHDAVTALAADPESSGTRRNLCLSCVPSSSNGMALLSEAAVIFLTSTRDHATKAQCVV